MRRLDLRVLIMCVLAIVPAALTVTLIAQNGSHPAGQRAARERPSIIVDYPADGSIFPPEFPAPTMAWRDSNTGLAEWAIDVTFADGAAPIHTSSRGEPMKVGEIDPRCVAPTNEPPRLTAEQAAGHTWTPDAATWTAIKRHSTNAFATLRISGRNASGSVSRAQVRIETSSDKVGAPIFYRDVPLMPSDTEKGVIKPLANSAMPLVAWRLRNVGETRSRLLMEGLHSCANCHSFSSDGRTMGIDVDGPHNDKGLYAMVAVRPHTSIANENVISWSTFRGKLGGKQRVGFMSQVSPTGDYLVTTIADPGAEESEYQRRKSMREVAMNYYVANFKDYHFLQVFYPTRGSLAWYRKSTGVLQPLPGADDPRYVQANAVWSPDEKYLVFARAKARDPYPSGVAMADHANDPRETQIKFDLYRIPFNGGKGGAPQPVAGASQNGMSNTFPKVSPDGRWIVFVQARNGMLMRPDSLLYIVPAAGGTARRMRCNTKLMNSWHSFSPNGRWMVFSSKSLSPYTQMFLTHIDEDGNDSPPILIANATAANRAVNIPEFVNIPRDGLLQIDAPATDYYTIVDAASELAGQGRYEAAAAEWRKAIELNPAEAMPHNNLGVALASTDKTDEAIAQYQIALKLSPQYPEGNNNLGEALLRLGRLNEAIVHFERALAENPRSASAHTNLGLALGRQGRVAESLGHLQAAVEFKPDLAAAQTNLGIALVTAGRISEAIPHLEQALKVSHGPDLATAHNNLGFALEKTGRLDEAIGHLEQAAQLSGGKQPRMLDLLGHAYAHASRFPEAVRAARSALKLAARSDDADYIAALKERILSYEAHIVPATE